MKRSRRFLHRRRRGATLVEFAFAAPIFLLFLFAGIEFVRAFNMLHTANNAAYEAARRGIVPGATTADVKKTVDSMLKTVGAKNATITITPAVINPTTTTVKVDISVPLGSNGWVAPHFFTNKSVKASMTMDRESLSQSTAP